MTPQEQDARFAAALAECGERVRRGEPLGRCLGDYPAAYREELARLVPLAARVAGLRRDPSPSFQAQLEQRLLAAVDEARAHQQQGLPAAPDEARPPARQGLPAAVDEARMRQDQGLWARLGRWLTASTAARYAAVALAVLFLLIGGGAGVVRASEDSLPDSPLYQVKTLREAVRLLLARGGEARVDVRARQIATRGRELELAVRAQKGPRLVGLLALRLADATDRMVDQALELRARGQPGAAVRAQVALRTMQRELDRLLAQAAPEARPPLQRLREFLTNQERRLTSPPVPLSTPWRGGARARGEAFSPSPRRGEGDGG